MLLPALLCGCPIPSEKVKNVPHRHAGLDITDDAHWIFRAPGRSTSCWSGAWTAGAGRSRTYWRLQRQER